MVDWRARFAEGFYQAGFDDPHGLVRRVSYVGCIDDLMIEEFVTGEVSGSSPLMAELSRSRGAEMKAAVATLQSEQDRLVRLDPAARLVLRGGPGHRQDGGRAAPGRLARLQRPPHHQRSHPGARAERPVPQVRVGGAADAGRGPHHPDHLRAAARARRARRAATSGGSTCSTGSRQHLPTGARCRCGHRRISEPDVAELVERVGGRDAAVAGSPQGVRRDGRGPPRAAGRPRSSDAAARRLAPR